LGVSGVFIEHILIFPEKARLYANFKLPLRENLVYIERKRTNLQQKDCKQLQAIFTCNCLYCALEISNSAFANFLPQSRKSTFGWP